MSEPKHTEETNRLMEELVKEDPSADNPVNVETYQTSDTEAHTEASAEEAPNDAESAEPVKKTGLRSRILLIVGIVLLAILLIAGGFVLSLLRQLRGDENIPIVERESVYEIPTMDAVFETLTPEELETLDAVLGTEPPEEEDVPPVSGDNTAAVTEAVTVAPKPIYKQDKKDANVINVLLLGRDARNASVEYGRTDSMIILSYNKKSHEVKLISLMRDMFVPIEGHDWNRINTAYAYGGIGLCINTINDVFQLDIQDYMTIDFNGLVAIIDAVGGIDVSLTPDEVVLYREWGILDKNAKAGVHRLTGEQALRHARNRALGSDFERTRRQRDILMAIFNRVTSSMTLTEVTTLAKSALQMVTTNLPTATILSLAKDVMTNSGDITFNNARLPFNGAYEGVMLVKDGYKMSVIKIDIAENVKQLHKLLYGES